jgi:hypothetical protein
VDSDYVVYSTEYGYGLVARLWGLSHEYSDSTA